MTTINPTPEHRQELRALLAKLRARAIPIMAGAGLHTYQVNSEPDPLCAKAADAISALLDHIERLEAALEQEPVAWLHTLHMEGGQTYTRLLDHDGRDEDEPLRTGFGIPGRDYSAEYRVTAEPLFRLALNQEQEQGI